MEPRPATGPLPHAASGRAPARTPSGERRRARTLAPWWAAARAHLGVLAGFALLVVGMTWPLAARLASGSTGPGDPLLVAWILAWEVHALPHLDLGVLFDTNIFHPHGNTLAYSELLLPLLVVAAPVLLLTGNPILAVNLLVLVAMTATAFTTYLLAWELTRSRLGGFVAGMVLAFSPFMFRHLEHVQLLFAAWIPLAFLFLHRFLERARLRDALGFAAVYCLQALTTSYYAVYLTYFAGLWILLALTRRRRWADRRVWLGLALVAVVVALVVGPFYARHLQLREEMAFARGIGVRASLGSYLQAPATSHWFGRPSAEASGEPTLFPGLVAVALAALAVAGRLRWPRDASSRGPDGTRRRGARALIAVEVAMAATAAALLALAIGIDFQTQLLGVPIRATGLRNPLLLLAALAAARWRLRRGLRPDPPGLLPRLERPLYPTLLLAAFVLSFGTEPYLAARELLPGLDALRAVSRVHVISIFALAVLAAEGVVRLRRRLPARAAPWLAVALPLAIGLEYLAVPVPVGPIPQGREVPEIYRWLARQPPQTTVALYPLHRRYQVREVYFSIYHFRRIVNGYSGFTPPGWEVLREESPQFPSWHALADLQALGVELAVVEPNGYRDRRRLRLLRRLERRTPRLGIEEIARIGGRRVYRLPPAPPAPPEPRLAPAADRAGWRLRASSAPTLAPLALDGDPSTFWVGPMQPGEWLELDLGRPRRVAGVRMATGSYPLSFPRALRVEASLDGRAWTVVAERRRTHPPIQSFLRPADLALTVPFAARRARHLRIRQEGRHRRFTWTVSELDVLEEARPGEPAG